MGPVDNRVGTGRHQATDGMSRLPMGGILPERPRVQCGCRGTCHVRCIPCDTTKCPGSCQSFGSGNKPCVQQSRSAYNERRKAFVLPERGPAEHFSEWKAGRARRKCPTGHSSQPQKARCTTACCWAVETPTTGVKAMKGLTRPCADLVESQRRRSGGHRLVGIELALRLTFSERGEAWHRAWSGTKRTRVQIPPF